MQVDLYERIWMGGAAALLVTFVVALVATAAGQAIQPPSHVETIDPATLDTSSDFGNPGVRQLPDGGVQVVGTAQMFSFKPAEIRVPAGRPVTFRLTSADVIHGFEVVGTNVNTMVIPGYVSQLTVTFPHSGEHLIVCNEFCGLGHHLMQGKLIVE